jgi:hypothetical protein
MFGVFTELIIILKVFPQRKTLFVCARQGVNYRVQVPKVP